MHHNCEYPNQSGYSLVEVVEGFCEVGTGCEKNCPFSWQEKDKKKERKANEAFQRFVKELEK